MSFISYLKTLVVYVVLKSMTNFPENTNGELLFVSKVLDGLLQTLMPQNTLQEFLLKF